MRLSKNIAQVVFVLGAFCLSFMLVGSASADPPPYPEPILWPDNGHYYQLIRPSQPDWVHWWTARKEAALLPLPLPWMDMNGHLATVTSQDENDFIEDNFLHSDEFPSVWLGGWQDRDDPGYVEPDGGWRWVTDYDEWDFENWAQGEPNDYAGNEDVLEIYADGGPDETGKWNDAPGPVYVLPYVVEWIPEPATSSLLALGALLVVRRQR
jgi:hypothetical protein